MSPQLMIDCALMLPELFFGCLAGVLLIAGAFAGDRSTRVLTRVAALGAVLGCVEFASEQTLWETTIAFNGMFITDAFAVIVKMICLAGTAMVLMISGSTLPDERINRFEYPVLVLLSALGMMVMVSANHFLTLYTGLELSSLALYVLAAIRRDDVRSSESGMKYFVLGALSSGMLLFGISIIYGFTGTMSYVALGEISGNTGALVGLAFVLAGLAFKISAVPFHMWTPDVYQGAPTPVVAFFAAVPKIAALAVIIRMLNGPFHVAHDDWTQIIAFLALASMLIGAFGALTQNNLKRLLAYGSFANVGYALLGLLAGTPEGISSTLTFMLIYMITTLGVFGVLLCVRKAADMSGVETFDDLKGLSRAHPLMAYILAMMMFSYAGIPPLAGFIGKFVVFNAAVSAGYMWLAIIGVLTSVVAAYYYLRVIRVMFFDESRTQTIVTPSAGQQVVLLGTALFSMLLILLPQNATEVLLMAAQSLFP